MINGWHNIAFLVIYCAAPAVFPPGEKTITETTNGGINYFKSSCPAFSNRVLVETIDVQGTSYLFASGTKTNPGPLTSSTVANETAGTTRRTCQVPIQGNSVVRENSLYEVFSIYLLKLAEQD